MSHVKPTPEKSDIEYAIAYLRHNATVKNWPRLAEIADIFVAELGRVTREREEAWGVHQALAADHYFARAEKAEAELAAVRERERQLREALREIDVEARSHGCPMIVTGDGPGNWPTDRAEHRGWTLGTGRLRRIRIRRVARAALGDGEQHG